MKVELDIFEMYYLLESCFRGSHLRSGTIRRFVDEWYDLFTPEQRKDLYEWVLRDIYDGDFKPKFSCCGEDAAFMARYNPDNQYRVNTLYDGKFESHDAFFRDGHYYTKSNRFVSEEYITSVENIKSVQG